MTLTIGIIIGLVKESSRTAFPEAAGTRSDSPVTKLHRPQRRGRRYVQPRNSRMASDVSSGASACG